MKNVESFKKWIYEKKFTIVADDGVDEGSSLLPNSTRSTKIDRLQLCTRLYSHNGANYVYGINHLAKDWENMGKPPLNEYELEDLRAEYRRL